MGSKTINTNKSRRYSMFPKLKKKIKSFLVSEDGKVPKQSLLSLGSFMSAAVISGVLVKADNYPCHSNSIDLEVDNGDISGSHNHHASHCSHSNIPADCTDCDCGPCTGE